MGPAGLSKRFWSGTRGRMILLLRRASRTVSELAQALNLTDNAIRGHLALLERDGLVHQSGSRAGRHKPTLTYELTARAQQLFPKVYGPVLQHLLDVLTERIAKRELEAILRAVGRRVARGFGLAAPAANLEEQLSRGVNVLSELGGLAEPERQDGRVFLRCFDCPLALVVTKHPEVCRMVETVLTETLGVPVREHCQRDGAAKCLFEVPAEGR